MSNRYIMTAFGEDRPGIVADVTRILYESGCNLEDTTMTLLADEFTLMLLFTIPTSAAEDQLQKDCRRLERDKGISAFMRPLKGRKNPQAGNRADCTLHVEGLDQAGIVFKVSRFLASSSVNILDLQSRAEASPQSGTDLYLMDIHLQLPSGLSLEELESGLSEVADELNVDISLSQG